MPFLEIPLSWACFPYHETAVWLSENPAAWHSEESEQGAASGSTHQSLYGEEVNLIDEGGIGAVCPNTETQPSIRLWQGIGDPV
ncbi:MAG: hypothetical protein F4226_04480 [Synechococcus sp. SB0678_bin_12]|nr:hypothetical protein [Synechococcus sp. SB0678_bin_12]